MPKINSNNIEIEYETFGDPALEPLLLVMGYGVQMIHWDEEFCDMLAKRGYYVIRYDNRDVGLSTKMEEFGTPDIIKAITAYQKGEEIEAPYTLEDMADDAVGLLDALNIDKAHICGASMGGMIAQYIAINHPSRVLSLTSMMSTTGNPDIPSFNPETAQLLITPMPTEREANIQENIKREKVMYGPVIPLDEKRWRLYAERAYDRCFYPQGTVRQLMAILKGGNRKPALASVNVPTLVIHGSNDPAIPPECGKDTAEAIPGAELLIIEGMGHSLPPEVWPQFVDAISKNAERAKN